MNNRLKSFLCSVAYSPAGDKFATYSGIKRLWADFTVRSRKRKMLAEAERRFCDGSPLGNLDDYKDALNKHWVTYSEYAYQYEFYKKKEEEREEYVSRLRMAYFYWRYAPGSAKAVFRNKQILLKTFRKYVHRRWIYVPDASLETFSQMVSEYDCIAKPCDGKLGKGIYKIHKDDLNNVEQLYSQCYRDRYLLEQCIESCAELKELHPQSLNTIRVVTVAGSGKACILSGVLRTGVGDSVVDNSHAGGISAQVNVETGIVETDGANTFGERFITHPDSGIAFKGFRVPKWDAVTSSCREAALQTDNPITGWDVVLDKDGNVELVEANYGPDMDMMQTRYGAGAKKKIYALVKEYRGIDLE